MVGPLLTRRALLLGLAWPQMPWARSRSTRQWLVGEWRSDAERSLASRSSAGRLLSPEERQAIAALYGRLVFRITDRHFTLDDSLLGSGAPETVPYSVAGETGSSIELRLHRGAAADSSWVFYRASDDLLFVRNRSDLEYFRRHRP